jgi:cytochrome c oxidase subunit 3
MNPAGTNAWRAVPRDERDHGLPGALPSATAWRGRPGAVQSVGLWVFMGVATALFGLLITAYVLRMSERDAMVIALPWQLWLSTAWLAAGSVVLQVASSVQRRPALQTVVRLGPVLAAGGVCALAFLAVQWWGWLELLARQVTPVGNPAGSLFYLLTAMHGLHVMGGLVAWGVVLRRLGREDAVAAHWRVALLARYWHFLLVVWGVLFATLAWVTPEVARIICRTA